MQKLCVCALQDEIAELKRKHKVQGNQIEQLKDDIQAKDRALVAEEFVREHCEYNVLSVRMVLIACKPAGASIG